MQTVLAGKVDNFGLSVVRATSGANLGRPLFWVIGPSGVRALPLAAGHYFAYFGPSGAVQTVSDSRRRRPLF